MKNLSVIITAGGIGKRMNSSVPKQFLLLKGKPLLMYTIEKFYHFDTKCEIVVTLPEDFKSLWEELLLLHDFTVPHRVVSGGVERYHSIKNALQFCHGDIIAIHDGVRPLVSEVTIRKCLLRLESADGVIPVMPINESIRKIELGETVSVPRSQYVTVQTPQCFHRHIIMKAYEKQYHEGITDDAGLVEEAGYRIQTVEGNEENIKITTPLDMLFAEHFLS